MECLLILLVLGTYFCVQVSSYAVLPVIQCPDQYDRHAWFNRAIQVCPSDHQQYHCLMVVDEKTAPQYAEFCMTAQTIRKGEYVVYSNATNGTVHQRCPEDKYQPVDRKSNDSMAFRCSRPKSTCNLEGQLQCDDGSPEKDRKCRCDFQAGYTLEAFTYENPDKIDCVLPRVVQLTCTKLDMCEDGQELNKYYQCVKKCPEGYYRPDGFGCHEIPNNMSFTETETTTIPTIATSPEKDDSAALMPNGENDNSSIVIAIIIILLVVLMIVVAILLVCFHREILRCIKKETLDDSDDDTDYKVPVLCCHFTKYEQNIQVNHSENVAIGKGVKIETGKKKKGNKTIKNTAKNKKEKLCSEEEIPLNPENEAPEGLTTDGNKEETDVKNAESTDLKETLSGSKGLDTEDGVEVSKDGTDNATNTAPTENTVDKELNSSSKDEGGNDAETTTPKETVCTKGTAEEREESPPDCNEYMKDMKLAAEKKGWAVVDVPKDGSCFYHCVLELYTTRNGWDVSTLRKKLKKYLENNSKHYKDFVSDPWETYLSGIESNRWADHLEIKAMAEMLKVSIVVYKLSSSGSELEIKEDIKIQNSHDEPLNIGHIVVNKEGFHFVALKQQVLIRS